ncbi:hypothetical protein DQ384_10765 [Sphaerisporangium album]|uniref:Uncharacterized protein n=1 Tax=Sphaerisporangium album TaxID=509200 RepID=A0A367FNL0_9ACTN|nr:hypothetical protein [Sphaerisporangium album]RCG31215.1 hypothetical protein DQ384_10765 [Sphaerisporangium album]
MELPELPDVSRNELMAVQLEEAGRLIERGTAAHARLAFILLDNAAELLMARKIEHDLMFNPFYERILMRWDEILQHTNDADARVRRDEIKAAIIPKAKVKELHRLFDSKVDFLVEKDHIAIVEGRVLKKLHRYRNELYHRDRIRAATVRSVSLLYFELACSLVERGDHWPLGEAVNRTSPELDRFNPSGNKAWMPTASMIVSHLRSGLGLDPAGLKDVLLMHLSSRLDELEADVAWASEMLPGFWPDAVIRLAQVHEDGFPDSLQQLIDANLKYGAPDVQGWRQAVEDIRRHDDVLELFTAFADLEDEFEPLEVHVSGLVARLDGELQTQIDLARGK